MSTIHAALRALGIQAVNSGGSTGKHWWSDHTAGSLIQSVNPATGEAIAAVRSCAAQDYEHIATQARDAFVTWRMVPAPKRGEIVREIADELPDDGLGVQIATEAARVHGQPFDVLQLGAKESRPMLTERVGVARALRADPSAPGCVELRMSL